MRKCTNCGCSMDEGYVWGDGEGYACSDDCLYVYGYTKADFEDDYEDDWVIWTQWEHDQEDYALDTVAQEYRKIEEFWKTVCLLDDPKWTFQLECDMRELASEMVNLIEMKD